MTVRKCVSCAAVFGALVCLSATCAAGGVYDDFESYGAGTGLLGKGIWSTWSAVPEEDGVVSAEQAATGLQSLKILAGSDVIGNIGITAGVWDVRAKVYVPAGHTGNSYFIILNEFDATQAWALQLSLRGTESIVYDQAPDPQPSLPLVVGAWSEIRTVVDLGANTQDIYYNGTPLALGVRWAEADKAVVMRAFDLFGAAGSTEVYFDDISVAQYAPGIETAGALLVNLDAADGTAGGSTWANAGALADFVEVGDPVAATVSGAPAVNFNMTAVIDAYQQAETSAPATLTRTNPTMSVEA